MENIETDEELALTQRYKAAIHYTVGKICEEVKDERGLPFSKQTVAVIAEATSRYMNTLATDLELFAKHGKRSTINVDDVKLCTRKSPKLCDYLSEVCPPEARRPRNSSSAAGGRKRPSKAAAAETNPDDEDSNLPE